MKTLVKLTADPYQCRHQKGDTGYVDGYVRGGDDIPYAVVVVGKIIDFVPTYQLEVFNI